ncbi:type II toxin-antitoxin system PemK/MazF family toxin [Hydrogenimonas sp.]
MNIRQGEIWLVNFDPTVGSEITKKRPCIVVNHDEIGILPLKTVVPLTDWKPRYQEYPWMLRIDPDRRNGLNKPSAADAFQIKNISEKRFVKRLGKISAETLFQVHTRIVKTLDLNL